LENRIRILVCDSIHEEGIEKLKRAGLEVNLEPTISGEDLKKVVSKYDALIVRSRTKVTREIIDAGRQLKVIGRAGVGVDNIDVKAAEERDILVLNTPEAAAEAVAELTMGLMISLARQIPFADQAMKEGRWLKRELEGWQLKGKTLGIIGLGNVGERVARIAKALEMRLLITKRTPPDPLLLKELGAEFVPFRELIRRSDVITIHVPLTSETHHLIGPEEFHSMKEGAFLINTSRGAIVDEKVLLAALQSRKLGGAALDVYETEPPTNLALVRLPNVVTTPHIGSQTVEAQKTAAIMIADKLINQLK
jgi:D-3-phosphoglycerate dehydrogenase